MEQHEPNRTSSQLNRVEHPSLPRRPYFLSPDDRKRCVDLLDPSNEREPDLQEIIASGGPEKLLKLLRKKNRDGEPLKS